MNSEVVYLRVRSHRARHKLQDLFGGKVPSYYDPSTLFRKGFHHLFEVPTDMLEEALKIKGITKARVSDTSKLCKTWSA